MFKKIISFDDEKSRLLDELIGIVVDITQLKDVETAKHIDNVCKISKIILNYIHDKNLYENLFITERSKTILSYLDVNIISTIFKLHDIGKLGINSGLLLSPKRLTPREIEIMKGHVEIGESVIKNRLISIEKNKINGVIHAFYDACLLVVSQHHEMWNGEGYPLRLKKSEISLLARICCICDIIDALFSERPYKTKWSEEEVYRYLMEEKGKIFDPTLVEIVQVLWKEIGKIYND